MLLGLLACCAFIAAVYVTGVHDASNAVAVPVRTRALGERSALYLAALFNVLGVIGAFLLLGEYSASWVSAPGRHHRPERHHCGATRLRYLGVCSPGFCGCRPPRLTHWSVPSPA